MEESALVPLIAPIEKQAFKFRWFHMLILLSFGSFGMFASDAYFAILETVRQDLHTNTFLMSVSVQMNWVFGSIFGSILGRISDLFGRRKVAIFSFVVFIIGCVGCSLATRIEVFLVWRFVQCVGTGGSAIAYAVIRDIENDAQKRVQKLGALSSAFSVTVVIAPTVGGIIGNYIGWRSLFYFIAAWAALTLFGFVAFFPETLSKEPHADSQEERAAESSTKSVLLTLVQDPYFLFCAALISFDTAAIYSLLATIPFVFSNYYHFSTLQVSFAMSAIPLFGSMAAMIAMKLSKTIHVIVLLRYGLIWMFIASTPLVVILVLKLYQDSCWVMIGASMLFGSVFFFNMPIMHSLLVENLKSMSGFAEGIGSVTWNAFGSGISFLAAFFYTSDPVPILIASLGSVAAAELFFWFHYFCFPSKFRLPFKKIIEPVFGVTVDAEAEHLIKKHHSPQEVMQSPTSTRE